MWTNKSILRSAFNINNREKWLLCAKNRKDKKIFVQYLCWLEFHEQKLNCTGQWMDGLKFHFQHAEFYWKEVVESEKKY